MFIKYPRKRLAMVGTPYHNVCPANFLILLNYVYDLCFKFTLIIFKYRYKLKFSDEMMKRVASYRFCLKSCQSELVEDGAIWKKLFSLLTRLRQAQPDKLLDKTMNQILIVVFTLQILDYGSCWYL